MSWHELACMAGWWGCLVVGPGWCMATAAAVCAVKSLGCVSLDRQPAVWPIPCALLHPPLRPSVPTLAPCRRLDPQQGPGAQVVSGRHVAHHRAAARRCACMVEPTVGSIPLFWSCVPPMAESV